MKTCISLTRSACRIRNAVAGTGRLRRLGRLNGRISEAFGCCVVSLLLGGGPGLRGQESAPLSSESNSLFSGHPATRNVGATTISKANGVRDEISLSFPSERTASGSNEFQWHSFFSPFGLNDQVHAMASDGRSVIMAGRFSEAGGVSESNVARWDGRQWSLLGGGLSGTVFALGIGGEAVYASNPKQCGRLGWSTMAKPGGRRQRRCLVDRGGRAEGLRWGSVRSGGREYSRQSGCGVGWYSMDGARFGSQRKRVCPACGFERQPLCRR